MTIFESAFEYMCEDVEIAEIDYNALLLEAKQVLSRSEYNDQFRTKLKEIKTITKSGKSYEKKKDYSNAIKNYKKSISEYDKMYKYIDSIPKEVFPKTSVSNSINSSSLYGDSNMPYTTYKTTSEVDPMQQMREQVYREVKRLKKKIAKLEKKMNA